MVAIEPSKTPLFRVLGEQSVRRSRTSIALTVFGRSSNTVAAFEETGRVNCVITKGGLRLECDSVVVGIGVEPVVDVAGGQRIQLDNGIVVDEYLDQRQRNYSVVTSRITITR